MALIKPSNRLKTIEIRVPLDLVSEVDEYLIWAGVSMDDFVEQSFLITLEKDAEWIKRKDRQISKLPISRQIFGKIETIRKAFAKLTSEYDVHTMKGGIESSDVLRLVHNEFDRRDIPSNTCIAQTSTFNRLIRNENNLRESLLKEWEPLKLVLEEHNIDTDSVELAESFKK
jgi:hypothetical protein